MAYLQGRDMLEMELHRLWELDQFELIQIKPLPHVLALLIIFLYFDSLILILSIKGLSTIR